jgi:multidrug resistance protein
MFLGSFSDSSGRRPAYFLCFFIWLAANIGLATQNNYVALLILRCLQSSGSSGTVALANAVAADIITSSRRGEFIGYTSVGAILAPSLAPVLGGLLSQYLGWRWIFWFLCIFGVAFFTPFFLFFPETNRKIVDDGSIPPPPLNHSLISFLKERRLKAEGRQDMFEERDRRSKERHIHFPNPLSTLRIIFDKTAGLALLGNGILFSCYYAVTSSLPSQFHNHYGLNDLQISLIFLPFGVGSLLSALTIGKIIDWNYARHAKRLGFSIDRKKQADLSDFPIERVRLEVAIPSIFVGAAGLLCYGWLIQMRVSIAAPCVFLFLIGYSITAGFNCMAILLIDMYPGKPATATAANNLVRCWMGAGAAAASVPLINAIGLGWTATLASAIWVGFTPVLIVIMRCGPKWRKEAAEANEKRREKDRQKKLDKEGGAEKDVKGEENLLQNEKNEAHIQELSTTDQTTKETKI